MKGSNTIYMFGSDFGAHTHTSFELGTLGYKSMQYRARRISPTHRPHCVRVNGFLALETLCERPLDWDLC